MTTSIVWFRKCIRLHDNPSFFEACTDKNSTSVLPLYIIDPEIVGDSLENISYNRMRFLFECLEDLDSRLRSQLASKLLIAFGQPLEVLREIQQKSKCPIGIFSDYCSEPYGLQTTRAIENYFSNSKSKYFCRTHFAAASHTITDIEDMISSPNFQNPKSMRDMVKLFSNHFGQLDNGLFSIPEPLSVPSSIPSFPQEFSSEYADFPDRFKILSLSQLHSEIERLGKNASPYAKSYFKGGETEALSRLSKKISTQPKYVNVFRKPKTMSTNSVSEPMEPSTSGLSPYLSTGCLSIRTFWKECEKCHMGNDFTKPPESLHGQMLFREMFYLLSRSVSNWDQDLDNQMCKKIDWGDYNDSALSAWEMGLTGFPYIDAMMRQLDATGWMHHLGRHAVSCFLTRGQLWQHWKYGRDVFQKKLLDSDWAVNNANWLWLSGVAPFSMPYFRLYNPCPDSKSSLNVETKTAAFIKFWIPELKEFPPKYILEPHLSSISIQQSSNCVIGKDYPFPMVNRKESAKENLMRFKDSLAA